MQLAARAGREGASGRAWLLCSSRSSCKRGTSRWSASTATTCTTSAPQAHAYGSIYYVLLGADHVHVGIGLLFSGWLLTKLVRGLTLYRCNALQAIALYWHAVRADTSSSR